MQRDAGSTGTGEVGGESMKAIEVGDGTATQSTQRSTERKRGFARLSQEERRSVSSRGGKAAHANGTAHEFTPEEASAAGKIGGAVTAAKARK